MLHIKRLMSDFCAEVCILRILVIVILVIAGPFYVKHLLVGALICRTL